MLGSLAILFDFAGLELSLKVRNGVLPSTAQQLRTPAVNLTEVSWSKASRSSRNCPPAPLGIAGESVTLGDLYFGLHNNGMKEV
jgi:hypothetical protein